MKIISISILLCLAALFVNCAKSGFEGEPEPGTIPGGSQGSSGGSGAGGATSGGKPCSQTSPPASGDNYSTLVCLPQLDAVQYWDAESRFNSLDKVSVTVALIDGGFNTDHPDLKGAIGSTFNFKVAGCTDPSKAGNPASCFDVRPVPKPGAKASDLNHGTVIAGVLAGRGKPNKGILGINPSAKLMLLADSGDGHFLKALRYAVSKRVDVISMSFSLGVAPGVDDVPEFKSLLQQAAAQGTVVVLAAGNSHSDVEKTAIYPTRYSSIPGVIAVGATFQGNLMSKFSNYGPTYVDLGAPGLVASSGGDSSTGALYSVSTGTSFAAPMVAGAAARVIQFMKSKGRSYKASDVEQILNRGSVSRSSLASSFHNGADLNMVSLWSELNK